MMLKYLPEDINIEDLLSYLPFGTYKIALKGLHKRNSYRDVIHYDEVDIVKGMNVSIITTATTDDEARALLKHLGMPFKTK